MEDIEKRFIYSRLIKYFDRIYNLKSITQDVYSFQIREDNSYQLKCVPAVCIIPRVYDGQSSLLMEYPREKEQFFIEEKSAQEKDKKDAFILDLAFGRRIKTYTFDLITKEHLIHVDNHAY